MQEFNNMPYIAILLSALAVLCARKEMERNRQMAIQGIILGGSFLEGEQVTTNHKIFWRKIVRIFAVGPSSGVVAQSKDCQREKKAPYADKLEPRTGYFLGRDVCNRRYSLPLQKKQWRCTRGCTRHKFATNRNADRGVTHTRGKNPKTNCRQIRQQGIRDFYGKMPWIIGHLVEQTY